VAYVRHLRIHSNMPNFLLHCCIQACNRKFTKLAALKSHLYRHHRESVVVPRSLLCPAVDLACHVDLCSAKCDTLTQFYSHLKVHIKEGRTVAYLKVHIKEGRTVACPFKHCDASFTVISTFTSHLSRKHKNSTEVNLTESIVTTAVTEAESSQNIDSDMITDEHIDVVGNREHLEVSPENIDETLFLKNLALFYLKLQAKLLLPSSVIQTIIEDMQSVYDVNQSHLLFKLNEKLVTLGVPETSINNLMDSLKAGDLLQACNSHTLKTDQRRKTVFKNSFNYIEPMPICLGHNEAGKECFVQYIPLKQTIEALFHCETVWKQYREVHDRIQSQDIFEDVWDGEIIKENLAQTEKSSLGLILYQDSFEVVNPLGSGKKKHKILAMYLTLADILPHNRSSTDQMQLVFLCREQDFKYFGQELVMGCLIKDLQDIETNGIVLPDGEVCKGIVRAIAGDNLGSHNIGGFLENFSGSKYFCRYCEIHKDAFLADPLSRANTRTPESYKEHVQSIAEHSTHSGGIKFDSLFNSLSKFHVCQPGLPPCLGHDLFEGVVASDLALCINHLVTVDKQFTYTELNRRIDQFKYLGNDANDKPCEVKPGSDRLCGHAVQNWCLLRLLPVLIGEKITSPAENEIWQMVLQLRDIVALICAPAISADQIGYLRVLIEEYLHSRKQAFPHHQLKPKHHYMSHYPELIIQFGPLIRLWTLRFESKHTYFKQCARKLHNFKNVCSSLAERHQLLQAYLSAGCLFPPVIVVEKATAFFSSDYSDSIRESVANYDFGPENTLIAHEATVKGTKYQKNMYVVLTKNEDGLEVGKIKMILTHKNSAVYFIAEKFKALCMHDVGVHCVTPIKNCYCCVNQEDLLDYYPLPQYSIGAMELIVLHHSFPLL